MIAFRTALSLFASGVCSALRPGATLDRAAEAGRPCLNAGALFDNLPSRSYDCFFDLRARGRHSIVEARALRSGRSVSKCSDSPR